MSFLAYLLARILEILVIRQSNRVKRDQEIVEQSSFDKLMLEKAQTRDEKISAARKLSDSF